jgi:sulfoxide reductase heme-binding subunit YedZ
VTGRRTITPGGAYWSVWALFAAPLIFDLWAGRAGGFSAREAANIDMGRWAWRFLLLGLAIRPAVQWLRRPNLLRYRRMVGLFTFAYAFAHSLDYLLYARAWNIPFGVWAQRLYLAFGIVATLTLVPLAVTSFEGLRRRMGAAAWRRLHKSLYAVGLMVMIHALWEDLIDYTQSLICSVLLVLLLLLRLPAGQRLIVRFQPRSRTPSCSSSQRLRSMPPP